MLKTLGIWGIAGAILFHAWRSKMTKSEFLSSVSASIASLSTSLSAIATAIQNHPSAGNPEFDPDGALANAASQLETLATGAQQAADALNPATPGGIADPRLTGDVTTSSGAIPQTAPTDPAAANTTVTTPPAQTADQAEGNMLNTDPSQTDTSGTGGQQSQTQGDVSGQTLGDAGLQPSDAPATPQSDTGGDDTGGVSGAPV